MPKDRNLIVEDLLVKPSAVSPMLFVGLGGCGCRMVARISRHLRQLPDYEERFRSLVKIALVDTNVNDLESYREIADETFLVSDFEKEQYANLAAGKDFLEADDFFTQWVPSNYRFRTGDTSGAGQIRIEARLGVYYQMKHKEFVPRFRRLLEDLKSHQHGHRRLDTSEIRIVICYSVAGGTGSGCHLPIAYMLREQAADLGKPRILGVAVLPAVFEDKTGINKDGTFANGYAALKETEHLMKLGSPESRFYPKDGIEFHFNPSDQSDRKVRTRPFEFLYVIDKPESFSVPDPVDAAADGLYLQFFSPLFSAQMSDYDNYTQHQRFLVPQDFGSKGIIGFTSFYGSFGAAVLMVPSQGLLDYCSQAAALGLMRASFLGEIPGDPVFQLLRASRERFHEVKLNDEEDEKPIPESEFRRKEENVRNKLRDRLFMKRVRLLAAAESNAQKRGRFSALFHHGHRLGEAPTLDGGFEFRAERAKVEREALVDDGMRYSIGAILLPLLAGRRPRGEMEILKRAMQAIQEEKPWSAPDGGLTVAELKGRAESWIQDYRLAGLRIVRDGFKDGTLAYPGMDELVDLHFMKTQAGEVDLAAKRYAVLRLLEEIPWSTRRPERTELKVTGKKDSDRIKDKDAPAIYKAIDELAQQRAFEEVQIYFLEQLGELKGRLEEFAKVQRVLELGFADLERQQNRRLERLRERGEVTVDESKPSYVLSAEALQAEDGRRLWDFYYEDKVSGLPDISLSNRRIQQVLSDTVTDLSLLAAETSTSVRLEQLFDALRAHTRDLLKDRIHGDKYSSDPERQAGLTLSQALELEVTYRALYRSHAEEIKGSDGKKVLQNLIAEYNAQPSEKKVDFSDTVHRDYLRDKIKRVVKEKASLLCVYEEARDHHGGVRPDHVFLAAIDENFQNSNIEEALRGADIDDLKWVSSAWHNEKEIIFYRAVLNVPLYVFGRMDDMRQHYHAFKDMDSQPKTLHIDRNWEDSLDDLDPKTAKEIHRKQVVTAHIINFACLLRTEHPHLPGHRCILKRDGEFYLVDPDVMDPSEIRSTQDKALSFLGSTMTRAIENLPDVLKEERVKFAMYQYMLHAVRSGLSPQLLGEISRLPFVWRRQREELRSQYAPTPSPEQRERLDDFESSYLRLQEALTSLLVNLRNREAEGRATGEHYAEAGEGMDPNTAWTRVRQSIEILDNFDEEWQRMEDPQRSQRIPDSFSRLFEPLKAEQYTMLLNGITNISRRDEARSFDGNGHGSDSDASSPSSGDEPGQDEEAATGS